MSTKIERIEHLLNVSRHLRDQLNAIAVEFGQLHNTKPGSDDHDDLLSVIIHGDDYRRMLLEIRRRHVRRHKKR